MGSALQPLELQHPPYEYERAFSVAVQGHAPEVAVQQVLLNFLSAQAFHVVKLSATRVAHLS